MSQRKSWTPSEDQILKMLYEERGMQKWNQIAIVMKQQFAIEGRNGKQCRQRYHNHLDTHINKGEWTLQQQKQLIQLHNQHGNKWSEIAKKLPSRSDNCVKNKYYSKLRKGIKVVNQHISQYYKKKFKLLKPQIIYKILQICQQKYKQSSLHSKQAAQNAFNLKNQIMMFSDMEKTKDQKQIQKIQQFIHEINNFNKINRRKSKKKIQYVESDQQDHLDISFEQYHQHHQFNHPNNKKQSKVQHASKRITRRKSKKEDSDIKSSNSKQIFGPDLQNQQNQVYQQEEHENDIINEYIGDIKAKGNDSLGIYHRFIEKLE